MQSYISLTSLSLSLPATIIITPYLCVIPTHLISIDNPFVLFLLPHLPFLFLPLLIRFLPFIAVNAVHNNALVLRSFVPRLISVLLAAIVRLELIDLLVGRRCESIGRSNHVC